MTGKGVSGGTAAEWQRVTSYNSPSEYQQRTSAVKPCLLTHVRTDIMRGWTALLYHRLDGPWIECWAGSEVPQFQRTRPQLNCTENNQACEEAKQCERRWKELKCLAWKGEPFVGISRVENSISDSCFTN